MSTPAVGKRFNPYRMFLRVSVIPNGLMAYPDLSSSAKLVWARLAQYAGKDGRAYPSVATLAADLGLKERQTQNLLTELRRKGFIESSRGPGTNSYYFLLHPCLVDGLKQDIAGPEANKCCSGVQYTASNETKKENQRKETTKKKAGRRLSFSDLSKKQQKYIELKIEYGIAMGIIHTSPEAYKAGLVELALKDELDLSGMDRLEAWKKGDILGVKEELDSVTIERMKAYLRHDGRSPREICSLIQQHEKRGSADEFWGLPIHEVSMGMRHLCPEYW